MKDLAKFAMTRKFMEAADKVQNQADVMKAEYESLLETVSRLQEENEKLKTEVFKDEELKRMKERLDTAQEDLRRGFPISKITDKKIMAWCEQHERQKHWDSKNNCPTSSGAIGGRFSYSFIPTGIGTLVTCKCCCGESISEMQD